MDLRSAIKIVAEDTRVEDPDRADMTDRELAHWTIDTGLEADDLGSLDDDPDTKKAYLILLDATPAAIDAATS